MAKLRSGNGTDYPNAIDTDLFADDDQLETDNQTIPRAAIPNDLALADIAIQTELGTEPAGSLTDVKTWLQTEHTSAGVHAGSASDPMTSFTLTTPTFDTTYTPTAAIWPSFKAFLSGAQTIINSQFRKIQFDDDSTAPAYDQGAGYDPNYVDESNGTDYEIPPGGTGKYCFAASVEITVITINSPVTISLYKDNVALRNQAFVNNNANDIVTPFLYFIEDCTAGEVYDIRILHLDSIGSPLTITNDSEHTWFTGFRVA
jgi:hypothetical protein